MKRIIRFLAKLFTRKKEPISMKLLEPENIAWFEETIDNQPSPEWAKK